MTNAPKNLHGRLLHLFPIKVVKEHFGKTGNAEDVIDEITSASNVKANLIQFVFDN